MTSPKELEVTVERVKRWAALPDTFEYPSADDVRTILDALASITRERDAMREGMKPFAALVECGCTFTEEDLRGEHDDEDWFRHDGCALKIGHFRRAAALVNGEVG